MTGFKRSIAALLLAAGLSSAPAAAERTQFGTRDVISIDPAKSYIFYRTRQRQAVSFLREVSPEERAAWQADRAEALARAQRRYESRVRDWQREREACNNRCMNPMERPEPVTDENFVFAPPEADNFVAVLAGRQFTREKPEYTYLLAVEPGTYALYGQLVIAQVTAGTCMCMGSVKFDAPAGQIVDLDELHYPAIEAGDHRGSGTRPGQLPMQRLVPFAPSMAVPARLAGLPIAPAALRAADKMPNYFGVLIDRLPPIEGVLAYDRDRVVELKAQATGGAGRD